MTGPIAGEPGSEDMKWMREAVAASLPFQGRTSPNPPVGCVLVRDGQMIGVGAHTGAGNPHAEVEALADSEAPSGATAYVTLEPCNHQGRTGPCAQALIDAGVSRVVVGVLDPNKKVAGGGVETLRAAGITVDVGVEAEACAESMAAFLRVATTGLPYVTLKLAATMDGRVGDWAGSQVWITGAPAQRRVHEVRNRVDAVMVGSGTVLHDNPRLTTRLPAQEDVHNPIRVVLDRRLRLSPTAALVTTANDVPTWVYTSSVASMESRRVLKAAGVDVIPLPENTSGNAMGLETVLRNLASRGVHHVLSEAGPSVAGALLAGGFVQEVLWFMAPTLAGDVYLGAINGAVTSSLAAPIRLSDVGVEFVGEDLLIRGKVAPDLSKKGA